MLSLLRTFSSRDSFQVLGYSGNSWTFASHQRHDRRNETRDRTLIGAAKLLRSHRKTKCARDRFRDVAPIFEGRH